MPQQGTILPGTTIQLGRFTVVIDRYIAEGGFAHVYLATLANGSGFPVVVKRIAVADKERLAIVNREIETMKSLGKHKNIVEYLDSCMGKLEGGGYEVLILMEYCGGGPVIDLMNRRLQHRLTEPEILKIFSNVCEAVAFLHYSNPPILHRDIKVENILLSNNDYKLCDFGSATTNILKGDNIPRNVKDIQLLEEEINNYTTLQYRAPEMLDLYMRRGIDEKIDIWALGVLLYKLCYYTTPFEEQGQLAILNVRYTIPDYPVFSPGLINLFKSMLKEDPKHRPNIYQVMKATSALRGLPCPIQNKYPDTSYTPQASEMQQSATANILTSATVARPMDVLPSIEPMRRGRPTRSQAAPAATSATQQNGAHVTSSAPSSQNDFSHGFDDSFGQFGSTTDPVSQFSKISSAGDAFDFENTTTSNKNESKRFTLDFGAVGDEFGFKFSNVESKDSAPVVSNSTAPTPATRPRPPSITSSDLLQFESTDKSPRSGAPLSTNGLSSASPNVSSQSSGMVKPLSASQQTTHNSGQPLLPVRPSANKGPSSSGSQNTVVPDFSSHGLRSTVNTGTTSEPKSSLELLQRQQLEQLGKFSLESASTQNMQGMAKALDPSRTLDGMKSQASPLGASFPRGAPLDKKDLSQKDLDSELKLIQLQQKEFEKQRKDLLDMQRREFEEQLQQHRSQQEQLQKQQQDQIQSQQEKWLERKRLTKERLTEQQLEQQQELQKRHESQQQLQQQQQQQQQLPDVSNVAASMASISLTTTDRGVLASAGQQKKQPVDDYKRSSVITSGSGQQATVIYPSTVLISSRPSLDENDGFRSTAQPASNSGVPVKSPRRAPAVTNGTGTSTATASTTSTTPTTSSNSPLTPSSTAAAMKPRRISMSNVPPGQKPQLMPKPTRFRMKDGTGSLASGEEEAFRKRFPTADLEDDLIQWQSPTSGSPAFSHSQPQDTTQYLTPSQRARQDIRSGSSNTPNGSNQDDEEEEEEETLVRRRRHQFTSAESTSSAPSSTNGGYLAQVSGLNEAEESTVAMESVRDRVQRMNRLI
ncbi:hypothetical protein BGX31_007722 [Mortierella sp. GBA43]|nr:hypothetical protein BGX31_007722 [Mortierella sp. GBA43]